MNFLFRQNRISAKMAEIRPKAETESVSVVHYPDSETKYLSFLTLICESVNVVEIISSSTGHVKIATQQL